MSRADQRGSPVRATGDINNHTGNGAWVQKDSLDRNTGPQSQLLFNLAWPSNVLNRATRVGPPGPIVIEKLKTRKEKQDAAESCSSSLRLSVLSEDQLQAAVRLAKKDLRRKRQESINSLSQKTRSPSPEKNNFNNQQNGLSAKNRQGTECPKRQTKPCTIALVYTPQKPFPSSNAAEQRQSPPTRDPGIKAHSSEPQLSREIRKLQKELETYVQRIEHLVNKERLEEHVEPDEKRRLEIRQQEQAARSSRMIYVLQQQVKEIQEDLDKLRSQSVKPTNASRAVNRLAAAHRGAVRAMQAFIQQLSNPAEGRVPVQCKELGQLIRQLSLCSAKVEVGQGSAVPETTLDILQKLEILDVALSKQNSQQEQEQHMRSRERISMISRGITSPPRFPQAQNAKATRRPKTSAAQRKKRRAAGRPLKAGQYLDHERKEVLRAGIQNLVQMRELREVKCQSRPGTEIPKSSSGAAHPDKNKKRQRLTIMNHVTSSVHGRDAGFQLPTVSSKLRESRLPQRESSVPWIPTSPHSPWKQRDVSNRPEQRCLFSPVKNSSPPTGVQAKSPNQAKTSTENTGDTQNEVLRRTWLNMRRESRESELNQLSEEEMGDVHRIRAEAGSPSWWTNRAEQTTREKLHPLLDCMQTAVSADVKATAGAMEKDGEHDALLRDPMLDNMLLRMEEIEKDEEEVRRRFAMISYSDPLLWDMDAGNQRKRYSSRPASPQPIRLTKPVQRPYTTGDIVLQRPVETGAGSENFMLDQEPRDAVPNCPSTDQAKNEGGILLKVPCSIHKNIQRYRKEHDSYLNLVSHAAVGSFNPWAVAESLAEELLMEALADVAGEFHNVCEEYAEAIFTSEFLSPTQSPAPSGS